MRLATPTLMTLWIVLSAVLTSCNYERYSSELSVADSLMDIRPDSSLIIINSIDSALITDKSEKARYALLLTEVRYKCSIDETSDTLISQAVSRYTNDFNNPYCMRSYYLNGIIQRNIGRFGESIISLKYAEKSATSLKDTTRLGLIYRSMGDTYTSIHNYTNAIKFYSKATESFKAINNMKYLPDSYCDLARAYLNARETDKCLSICYEALEGGITSQTPRICNYLMSLLLACQVTKGNYTEARILAESLMSKQDFTPDDKDLTYMGIAYLKSGNVPQAHRMANSLSSQTGIGAWLLRELAADEEDLKGVIKYSNQLNTNDRTTLNDWMGRDYEENLLERYQLSEDNARLNRKMRTLYIGVMSFLFVVAIAFIVYLYTRRIRLIRKKAEDNLICMRKDIDTHRELLEKSLDLVNKHKMAIASKSKEIEEKDKTIEDKIKAIKENDKAIEEKNEIIEEKIKIIEEKDSLILTDTMAHFSYVNKLLRVYYEEGSKDLQNKRVLKIVGEMISQIKTQKSYFRDLTAFVDSHLNNLVSDMEREIPDMTEEEKRIFVFSLLGLGGKSIGVILGINYEYIFVKKSGLKKKVSALKSPVRERFLTYFRQS